MILVPTFILAPWEKREKPLSPPQMCIWAWKSTVLSPPYPSPKEVSKIHNRYIVYLYIYMHMHILVHTFPILKQFKFYAHQSRLEPVPSWSKCWLTSLPILYTQTQTEKVSSARTHAHTAHTHTHKVSVEQNQEQETKLIFLIFKISLA